MLRTLLGYVVIFALTCFSVLFAQIFWVCEKEDGWKEQLNPQCVLGEEVAIVQVISMCSPFLPYKYKPAY